MKSIALLSVKVFFVKIAKETFFYLKKCIFKDRKLVQKKIESRTNDGCLYC